MNDLTHLMPTPRTTTTPTDPVGRFLREKRLTRGMTQEVLANEALMGQKIVSSLERGDQSLETLGFARVMTLLTALNITLPELEAETGLNLNGSIAWQFGKAGAVLDAMEAAKLPDVPGRWLDVLTFAGGDPTGIYTEDFQSNGDRQFIRTEDDSGPGLVLITVQGDSMAGGVDDIQDHDLLYVDTKQLELLDNKIFVVHVHGNGYMVKRVHKFEREVWLMSDNPVYAPMRPKQITVIGRVLSSARLKRH
jgi:repressor LexA